MKFQNKIKFVKTIDKIKLKIRDLLHKKPFYRYLYKRIQYEIIYNNKSCIRYYLDADTLRDESFKAELQLYHKVYGTEYDDQLLEELFIFTHNYIKNKIFKYKDIGIVHGKDDYGLYFEVGYEEGY